MFQSFQFFAFLIFCLFTYNQKLRLSVSKRIKSTKSIQKSQRNDSSKIWLSGTWVYNSVEISFSVFPVFHDFVKTEAEGLK